MKKTILVIESDPSIRRTLVRLLSGSYTVFQAKEETSLFEAIQTTSPHLVILDQVEECASLRQQRPDLLLIILSTASCERSIVSALDCGADDYVIYPFSQHEFTARVRALFRRATRPGQQHEEPQRLESRDGYLTLDAANHQAAVAGRSVRLTPTEFALVWQLLLHEGKVLTHRALLQAVWGSEYSDEGDYLRVYVRQLRRKIEADPSRPRYLLTEIGVGYVLRCPGEEYSHQGDDLRRLDQFATYGLRHATVLSEVGRLPSPPRP